MTNNNTYKITINKELIHEYHLYYLKKNPKCRTLPFTKPRVVKDLNKDGTQKLTKGGKPKTKKESVNKKDYTIDDCIYGTMSLNDLLVINDRMIMNTKKEKWGELGEWIADKFNLSSRMLTNALVEYRIYSETNAQKDNDNISAGIKFLNDGLFVKSNFFVDDSYLYINPLVINCDYDKENPRTEIRISIFDDSIKDIYEKMKIHTENFKEI